MDEGRGIYSVAMFHVVAKSALRPRLFMPMAKKTSSARPLAPPFQIEPAALGFDLSPPLRGGFFLPQGNIDFDRPFQT